MPNDGKPIPMDLGRILPDQYNAVRPEGEKKTDAKGSESTASGLEDIKDFGSKPLSHDGLPFELKR